MLSNGGKKQNELEKIGIVLGRSSVFLIAVAALIHCFEGCGRALSEPYQPKNTLDIFKMLEFKPAEPTLPLHPVKLVTQPSSEIVVGEVKKPNDIFDGVQADVKTPFLKVFTF